MPATHTQAGSASVSAGCAASEASACAVASAEAASP